MTLRRLLAGVLLLAILLLAADTLAWLQLQRLLDRRLDLATQQAAHAGWRLEAVPGHRGGWPLAATRDFAGPRLSHGGLVWSGQGVSASLSLLHPRRVTILADGPQVISADGTPLGRSLRFWGSGMVLHLPLGPTGRPDHVDLEARTLRVALPGAGPDDVMTAGRLRGLLRWNPDAHALTLSLHDVRVPQAGNVTIGNSLPDAALELSLVGPIGREGDDLAQRVRGWRAGSGRLLLRQAALGWPGARIEASGQASLDGNFQPDGGVTVRLTGADVLLDRLAQSGRVAPSTVAAIRAVLGLIAAGRGNPDGTGARHPLELWLALHAGLLSLGQIPLLRLPSPLPDGGQNPVKLLP